MAQQQPYYTPYPPGSQVVLSNDPAVVVQEAPPTTNPYYVETFGSPPEEQHVPATTNPYYNADASPAGLNPYYTTSAVAPAPPCPGEGVGSATAPPILNPYYTGADSPRGGSRSNSATPQHSPKSSANYPRAKSTPKGPAKPDPHVSLLMSPAPRVAEEQDIPVIVAPVFFGREGSVKTKMFGKHVSASDRIRSMCTEFTYKSLRVLEPELHDMAHAAIKHNHISEKDRRFVESSIERLHNFLRGLDVALHDENASPKLVLPQRPALEPVPDASAITWSPEEEAKRKQKKKMLVGRKALLHDMNRQLKSLQVKLEAGQEGANSERAVLRQPLDEIRPALLAAESGVQNIPDESLFDLRHYTTPPRIVHRILSAVLLVLGVPDYQSWEVIRHHITTTRLMARVRAVAVESLPENTCVALRKYVNDSTFTDENAAGPSAVLPPLRYWVSAISRYLEAFRSIRPDLDRLELVKRSAIDSLETAVKDQRREVARCEEEIRRMEATYNSMFNRAELEARRERTRAAVAQRNERKLMQWDSQCAAARAAHARAMHRYVTNPPFVDAEARTAAKVCRVRCEELLAAVESSLRSLRHPVVTGGLEDMAPPQRRHEQAARRGNVSADERAFSKELAAAAAGHGDDVTAAHASAARLRARSASRRSPCGARPWHQRLYPQGVRATPIRGTANTPSPQRRRWGASPTKDSSCSKAQQPYPLRKVSTPEEVAQASWSPRSMPSLRSMLARPDPNLPYRHTAVERFYLAAGLHGTPAEDMLRGSSEAQHFYELPEDEDAPTMLEEARREEENGSPRRRE